MLAIVRVEGHFRERQVSRQAANQSIVARLSAKSGSSRGWEGQLQRVVQLLLMCISLLPSSVMAHAQAAGEFSKRSDQATQTALQDLIGAVPIEQREAVLYTGRSLLVKQQRGLPEQPYTTRDKAPPSLDASVAATASYLKALAGTRGILPGLPSSLVAVIEGGAPPRVTPSSAENVPAAPAMSNPISANYGQDANGPVAVTADVRRSPASSESGLFLPFERGVGAAAFSRGGDTIIVFDTARPLDLSAVQSDPFGAGSSIQLLPEATLLHLPALRGGAITLRRLPMGWLVGKEVGADAQKPIVPLEDGASLRFPVEYPGRTVTIPDPLTGGNLLVGTLRGGQGAVRNARRESTATIEQTFQGIVVEPLSDRLELQATEGAFILSGVSPDALGAGLSQSIAENGHDNLPIRVMSLDPGSDDVLALRFEDAKAEAAASPAAARFLPRLRAAEDAIAMGEGVEAATIIHVALADDPRAAAALRPRLVSSAAALLSHQANPPDLLRDSRIAVSGELALWRAVMLAEADTNSTEAARLFAANLAFLETYPQPLQAALLPLAAETLVRAGTDAQAEMVARLPHKPSLTFARALLSSRNGNKQDALTMLDQLAASPDWALGDKAAEEAAVIRQDLAGSDLSRLADALEARLLDARIAGHEAESLLSLADLRTRARQWQKALDLLRDLASRYPGQAITARRRVAKLLERLMTAPTGGQTGAPLDDVAMIEGNTDMLPSGPEGVQVSLFLAEKLAALDLPEQAAPIVRRLMLASDPGPGRAALGMRLATLDFQQNDLVGAESALRTSDLASLPSPLAASRAIMMARALAGQGKLDQALATLAPLHSVAALDLKATLLTRRRDWAGAADSLAALVRQHLPKAERLDPAGQDLLLRLASAASQTGDSSHINQARALGQGRFTNPGKQALFQLLTSDPHSGPSDPEKEPEDLAELRHSAAIIGSVAQ